MKKIRKSDPCPCGSTLNYIDCCYKKVDWNNLLETNDTKIPLFLTARGKNLIFIQSVIEFLDIDIRKQINWSELKTRLTPEIVFKIYSTINELWPTQNDLLRVYNQESKNFSALYLGGSEPELIINCVKRHCLYNEIILISDPFPHPMLLKKEFNPLYRPDQHLSSTLKFLYLWFNLYEWIIAGIVRIVRVPTDYDVQLLHRLLNEGYNKSKDQYLRDIVEKEIETSEELNLMKQYHLFSHTNKALIEMYKEHHPDCKADDIQKYISVIEQSRKNHPYYIDPVLDENGKGSDLMISRGLNYDTSKLLTSITNSHLITSSTFCWKEIELDRKTNNANEDIWEPFSNTFQKLEFSFLDKVTPTIALTLRKENRLQSMRSFLHKVWKNSTQSINFSESNVELMTQELKENIQKAKEEWKQIDKDLLSSFGKDIVLASTGLIVQGQAGFIASGSVTAAAGIYELLMANNKKKKFKATNPAAFFLSKKIK